jgi:hypothetical protein
MAPFLQKRSEVFLPEVLVFGSRILHNLGARFSSYLHPSDGYFGKEGADVCAGSTQRAAAASGAGKTGAAVG